MVLRGSRKVVGADGEGVGHACEIFSQPPALPTSPEQLWLRAATVALAEGPVLGGMAEQGLLAAGGHSKVGAPLRGRGCRSSLRETCQSCGSVSSLCLH